MDGSPPALRTVPGTSRIHPLIAGLGLGLAIQIGNGTLTPTALALVIAVTVSTGVAIGSGRGDAAPVTHEPVLLVRVAFLLQATLSAFWISRLLRFGQPGPFVLAFAGVAVFAWALVGWDNLDARPRLKAAAPAAFLTLTFTIGVVILLGYQPITDVLLATRLSAEALMKGANPYDMTFPNPYGPEEIALFYGPGVANADRLLFGYMYPPLNLAFAVGGRLLGDVRFGVLAPGVGAAGLICLLGRGHRVARWAMVLFVTTPLFFYVMFLGWTEPIMVCGLALFLTAHRRWPRLGPWLFGLFAALKQYSVVLAPLYLVLLPRPLRWRSVASAAGRGLAAAALVTVPFLLWNPRAFSWSVLELQFHQPFRKDALSLLAWSVNSFGWPPPATYGFLPLVAAAAAASFAVRRAPRSPAGFAASILFVLCCFLLAAKQAFTNYYFLAIGAAFLWLAASSLPEDSEAPRL